VCFVETVLFFGEKKPPEAAAHRRTGFFCHTMAFVAQKVFFSGGKNAGGRRAPKNSFFCHKSVCALLKQCSFLVKENRRRPPRTEQRGFLS
jgi:hypothetical protein